MLDKFETKSNASMTFLFMNSQNKKFYIEFLDFANVKSMDNYLEYLAEPLCRPVFLQLQIFLTLL